jgi:hypothetical protein
MSDLPGPEADPKPVLAEEGAGPAGAGKGERRPRGPVLVVGLSTRHLGWWGELKVKGSHRGEVLGGHDGRGRGGGEVGCQLRCEAARRGDAIWNVPARREGCIFSRRLACHGQIIATHV